MNKINSKRYHVIVDITGVDPKIINDKEGLHEFLTSLPETIGMRILHGPVVVDGVPENPGITGFVIIDYSHISVHTFSKFNEVQVDVFSCKEYAKEALVNTILEYFAVSREKANIQEVYWG